jgi:hypothetical protein
MAGVRITNSSCSTPDNQAGGNVDDIDLYLKTDHATLVHMNSVFNAVANPHEEWPASTRVASEREFGFTEPFHPAISRA